MEKTADEVVTFLEHLKRKEWNGRVPKTIQTDNGTEFKNVKVIRWCRKNKVVYIRGTPHYPRSQGQVSPSFPR